MIYLILLFFIYLYRPYAHCTPIVHVHVCMRACMQTYMYVRMYVYNCMYVPMYVYVCIRIRTDGWRDNNISSVMI